MSEEEGSQLPRGRIYPEHTEAKQALASLRIGKKSRSRSLKSSHLFHVCGIKVLGPGSSWLDMLRCPGLGTFVTFSDSGKTTPGYSVNTSTSTFLDGERKTNLCQSSGQLVCKFCNCCQRGSPKRPLPAPNSAHPGLPPAPVAPQCQVPSGPLFLLPQVRITGRSPWHTPCPSAQGRGYYTWRFVCQATHTCSHQK